MWCLPCFKPPSTPEDLEFDLALQVSREEEEEEEEEAVIEEAKHLSYALQESSRLHQRQEAEQKSRARELEKDAQIALAFQYHETEMHNNSVLDKGKIKQLEEQVKKDEELALILHESLNMLEPPPRIEERKSIPPRAALLDVEEQLAKESLKEEKGKGKLIEGEQVKKDEELALILHESLNMVEPPPCSIEEERKSIPRGAALDVEEHLAKAVKESLKEESLIKGKGKIKEFIDGVEENGKLPEVNPPRSICRGCNSEIEHGRSVVDVLGVLWHPECLWCDACHKPIAVHEVENHVSNSRGKFHNACYERYCYVCQERKMKKYNHHPFCPAHDSDGTPKCCSCERLEPKGTNYVLHGDGRWLCLECMESAVMDTDEVEPLYFEIREFFEGLNMKIEKAFPFLLVEKQALNKAQEEEKIDYQYEVVTRGICLSEAQTVTTVSKRPRMGPYNQLIDMVTESQRVARNCEVTAILILYGLPRLMTGYILAHEMMHAYLRLKGYRNLNNVMEEGICQVLGHMWLESQTYAPIDVTEAVASSSHTPAATASKKGVCSDFEKKLVQFCKNQIETDESRVYGVGFRKVNKMVTNSSLQETLKEIVRPRG